MALAAYAVTLPAFVVWLAGGVGSPVRAAHTLLVAAIAVPLLLGLPLVAARRRALRPAPVGGVLTVATLFFGLGVAVLLLPFGLVPTWLALASIGFDLIPAGARGRAVRRVRRGPRAARRHAAVAAGRGRGRRVAGVRPYSQRATAAGLDPVARRAWQWFTTSVPQRSLHNWQNAAARLVADDLRSRSSVDA